MRLVIFALLAITLTLAATNDAILADLDKIAQELETPAIQADDSGHENLANIYRGVTPQPPSREEYDAAVEALKTKKKEDGGVSRLVGSTQNVPTPIEYVAVAVVPFTIGLVIFLALYVHFYRSNAIAKISGSASLPLISGASDTDHVDRSFTPRQKLALVIVAVVTVLLTVGVALGVALPGRVGVSAESATAAADAASTVGRASQSDNNLLEFVAASWTAQMGGRIIMPAGAPSCYGPSSCGGDNRNHHGIFYARICGYSDLVVCVSGGLSTSNAHRGSDLIHEVMHLYMYRLSGRGFYSSNWVNEGVTDCLARRSGASTIHYGCSGGNDAVAADLLSKFPVGDYPWPNGPKSTCFPGDAVVVRNGVPAPISSLVTGDTVADADGATTTFISWIKREANNDALTYEIEYVRRNSDNVMLNSNATTFTLSAMPNHLIYTSHTSMKNARDIYAGESLWLADSTLALVTAVRAKQRHGIYAPLTESGSLVVDGVVCSNYAEFTPEDVPFVHATMSPMRVLYQLLPSDVFSYVSHVEDGFHPYVAVLMTLWEVVLRQTPLHHFTALIGL